MAKLLKIKRETAVKLFEELGFKTAKKWDTKRMQAKVKNLPELTDGVKIRNPKVRKILKAVLAADKVVIKTTDDEQQKEESPKIVKKIAKKVAKKVEKVVKKKGPKKLGVIMSVLEFIRKDGPISEKQILANLKRRFPDRDPEAMGRSILCIPSYLSRKKGIDIIRKNDKGQYCIKK